MAKRLSIHATSLQKPLSIMAVDGSPLGSGEVSYCTPPLQLWMGEHTECKQFFLIHSPKLPLILGYSWLDKHNPHIDWTQGVVRGWGTRCQILDGPHCQSSSVSTTPSRFSSRDSKELLASNLETCSPRSWLLQKWNLLLPHSLLTITSDIPHEYWDLREIFSKTQAATLPPHRPYDCAINLIPGMCPQEDSIPSLVLKG